MVSIYVLSHPITNEVFYVGATTKTLKERLKGHYSKVYEAKKGDINWNKRLKYLNDLLPLKANITQIGTCDLDESDEAEKYAIEQYSKVCELTNQTKGGKGNNTYNMLSDEQKIITKIKIQNKLKGKPKPEGFSENLSEKRKGYDNPMGGKTKKESIVLCSNIRIIIFKNAIECNNYFEDKYAWCNIHKYIKYNKENNVKRVYKKVFEVNNLSEVKPDIKDIVESLLEREGNCYVYNRHTEEVTIN